MPAGLGATTAGKRGHLADGGAHIACHHLAKAGRRHGATAALALGRHETGHGHRALQLRQIIHQRLFGTHQRHALRFFIVRATLEALFQRYRASPATLSYPHEFRYRMTRQTAAGIETVEAPEHEVPDVVRASVSARIE